MHDVGFFDCEHRKFGAGMYLSSATVTGESQPGVTI